MKIEQKQKITPFLWFESGAEEAIEFYTGVFPDSSIGEIRRIDASVAGGPADIVTGTIYLLGQPFMILNGGQFEFTPAISLFISCESQEEIDYYWEKLLQGGRADMCGWLQDKFGVSWQIVPHDLDALLSHKDPEISRKVMSAMLKMRKLDMDILQKAARKE